MNVKDLSCMLNGEGGMIYEPVRTQYSKVFADRRIKDGTALCMGAV